MGSVFPYNSSDQQLFLRRQRKNRELVHLIRSNSDRVWIINAYLAPSKRIIAALKKAQKRGADVKILISRRSDVILFPLVSTAVYGELLKANIKIYEYITLLHCMSQ